MTHDLGERFPDVAALTAALGTTGYLAGNQLAAALFLAVRMGQPIRATLRFLDGILAAVPAQFSICERGETPVALPAAICG